MSPLVAAGHAGQAAVQVSMLSTGRTVSDSTTNWLTCTALYSSVPPSVSHLAPAAQRHRPHLLRQNPGGTLLKPVPDNRSSDYFKFDVKYR